MSDVYNVSVTDSYGSIISNNNFTFTIDKKLPKAPKIFNNKKYFISFYKF